MSTYAAILVLLGFSMKSQNVLFQVWLFVFNTLYLLAQPELTENRTARKSDTKERKNKHSSRPVGGAETGSLGREESHGCGGTETGGVWDERGRQSDHGQTLWPHILTKINQEGQTQSGGERGRQSGG